MLFSTLQFWGFFSVLLLVLGLNRIRHRSLQFNNLVLLGASYWFYAAWDWRFLGLILLCTVQTWMAGRFIAQGRRRRAVLVASILINLGVLGTFKYLNFFLQEFSQLLGLMGFNADLRIMQIVLPVGVSFYTFQSLGYVVDVFLGRTASEPRFHRYALFVAFFPQLVAGPIERSTHLLRQFRQLPETSAARVWQGLKLVIVGLFLKVFVADNLAPMVDRIFEPGADFDGGVLALGALYFSLQIYGDFCGYSTMAIGIALMMGYSLMTNFETPYFSTSMQEFWRRWHISLSTFFRDYVYIPLGGSRTSEARVHFNTIATFTVSGVWHGANWTFLIWGLAHGTVVSLERACARHWAAVIVPVRWFVTMLIAACLWVVFRSPNLAFAADYLWRMFSSPTVPSVMTQGLFFVFCGIVVDLMWRQDVRLSESGESTSASKALLLALMAMVSLVQLMTQVRSEAFIYFQF